MVAEQTFQILRRYGARIGAFAGRSLPLAPIEATARAGLLVLAAQLFVCLALFGITWIAGVNIRVILARQLPVRITDHFSSASGDTPSTA